MQALKMKPSYSSQFSEYQKLYQESISSPEVFWAEQGKRLSWSKSYTKVKNTSFSPGKVSIKWYEDGELNACYNCLDRHIPKRAEQVAIIFEGDVPGISEKITYTALLTRVKKCANALKSLGVTKGDRVIIYLPMIPEAAVFMLACARIGAVHSIVFGGFSSESLASRIADCSPKVVVTADVSNRGGKVVPLKENVDKALVFPGAECVERVIVVSKNNQNFSSTISRDVDYEVLVKDQSNDCPCEVMNAEDPLFILYTSGSTGKPKGVLHTTGGYLVYTSLTHEYVFDYQEGEVFWCTADVGWVTGHSYVVYGPLLNGATTLMFEGVPNYPDYSRFWQVIDKYKVNIFYTAPTAIRALRSQGDEYLDTTSRKSLRILGTVGEPIDPTSWQWYFDAVGKGQCYVVDTWWQTETGGHMITPIARFQTPAKPGSVTLPFLGVNVGLVDADGKLLEGKGAGNLCILDSWPGQARTLYNAHDKFEQVYFSTYPGKYFTGDGAERDKDGYYWITGRVDDVLNVSGHRLGTNELESAIVKHEHIAEAAVVGYPHDIKGQGIYAYVVPYHMGDVSAELTKELIQYVRHIIGPIATLDKVQWTDGLPKTRSGKVMRRILRKIAEGDVTSLGDTSTLSDPSVVDRLISGRV